MEFVFEVLLLLVVQWRIGFGLLAGGLAAFLAAVVAGGLGPAGAIVTVLLGLGAGMLWHIGHERSKQARPSPPGSSPNR